MPRRATAEVEHVVVHGTAGGSLITRTVVQHEGGNWGPSNNNGLPPNKPPNDGISFLDMWWILQMTLWKRTIEFLALMALRRATAGSIEPLFSFNHSHGLYGVELPRHDF